MVKEMGKYITKLKRAGINIIATGSALVSAGMAFLSGHSYGAAFPLAVAYITGKGAYSNWKSTDQGSPPPQAVGAIRHGIYESAQAKGVIALAGAVSAIGEILPLEALVPSLVIPLGISSLDDLLERAKLQKK